MTAKMRVHPPLGLHADTLERPENLILARGPSGDLLVAYCRRNRVGGVWHRDAAMWTLWSPIGAPEFIGALSARGIEVADGGHALEVWLDAVTGPGEAGAKH
jgi:hypothetical protein